MSLWRVGGGPGARAVAVAGGEAVAVVAMAVAVFAVTVLSVLTVFPVFSVFPVLAVAMSVLSAAGLAPMLPPPLLYSTRALDLGHSDVLAALRCEPLQEGLIGDNVRYFDRQSRLVSLDACALDTQSIRGSRNNDLDVCSLGR